MWPLDVSILVLSGVVLYLVFSKLRFDDPRLIYSGRFYAVAVPAAALTIAVILRGFASQYVQKSAQLGFLLSVTVHLMLLILAFQWVIFRHHRPDSASGVRPDRSPIRRTVPEYLFQRSPEPTGRPDWAQPVEASASTRSDLETGRQPVAELVPRIDRAVPTSELPNPIAPEPEIELPAERVTAASSLPTPSDSSPRLAPRQSLSINGTAPAIALPDVPQVLASLDPVAEPLIQERSTPTPPRSSPRPVDLPLAATPQLEVTATIGPDPQYDAASLLPELSQTASASVPAVRDAQPLRPSVRRPAARSSQPLGPPPERPTVAVARSVPAAERMLSTRDIPVSRQSQATPAVIGLAPISEPASAAISEAIPFDPVLPAERPGRFPDASLPEVVSSPGDLPGRVVMRSTSGSRFAPQGTPQPFDAARIGMLEEPHPLPEIGESIMADLNRRRMSPGDSTFGSDATFGRVDRLQGPLALSLDGHRGEMDSSSSIEPSEFSRFSTDRPELRPSAELPRIADFGPSGPRRAKRKLDRPPDLAGTEVIAAKPFQQRVTRVQGAASPAPAGSVGPATEQAIERGLAYLAERQNADGNWSLEGHGEPVLLRSDTAATGLCLLAFQGAGYTHRQHQYASTVARGLQFLVDRQRTNGDLFVPADATSNQNVALYSHGIAALALCEAYGMTQDPELRESAQLAVDYVVASQHRRLGGWRYTPQVSADTSVSGWMMMALKSGELAGLEIDPQAYEGINRWLEQARAGSGRGDRYRYNPFAPDTPTQRHGRFPTPTMTAVGMLMRMYSGWTPDDPALRSGADYLLQYPPHNGTPASPQRDTYYWYYATQVMFQMGGDDWKAWNRALTPALLETQVERGAGVGSWDPAHPVPDRWSPHAGRLYVTAMNLLNLEVTYRHLPIYGEVPGEQ